MSVEESSAGTDTVEAKWRNLEFDDFAEKNEDVEMQTVNTTQVPEPVTLAPDHSFFPAPSGIQQRRIFHYDANDVDDRNSSIDDDNHSSTSKGLKPSKYSAKTGDDEEEVEIINEIQQAIINGVELTRSFVEESYRYIYDQAPQSIIVIVGLIIIFISIIVIIKGAVANTSIEVQMASVRPVVLHNGVINPMASELYDIIEPLDQQITLPEGEGVYEPPPSACIDKYFRCEYYWASETSNARRLDKTYFCTYYVCKEMTVKVSVFPQTCSGNNRVGIVKYDHEMYYGNPLSYACSNTGCGECSSAQITVTEGATLAFLQGCNADGSCYGQIEVSVVPSAFAKTSSKEPKLVHRDYQLRQYANKSPNPKYRGGPGNQGRSAYKANDLTSIEWKFRTNYGFKSSPVIDGEGSVYIGSDDHSVYSIEANGAIKWRFVTQGKVTATPVLSSRDTLYVGSEDSTFYCLNLADGSLKWEYKTGGKIYSSAVVGYRGIVYFGSFDGHLYALSGPGDLQWAFSTISKSKVETKESKKTKSSAGAISSSPALSPIDGTIYFGCEDSTFFAVSPEGVLRWEFRTGQGIYSSPAVSSDGSTIYFGSDDGYLYALSSSGALKFRFKTDDRIRSSPAIASDGSIIFVQDNMSGEGTAVVYAVTPSGLLKWKYQLSEGSVSSPTISDDGVIFVGSDDHCLYAINSLDGNLKGIFKTEGKITASPAIGADGTVYVGSWISALSAVPCSLYAFAKKTDKAVDSSTYATAPAPPLAASSWWCSDLAGGDLEYRCAGDKPHVTCIPGLESYIGRGVDITYGRNELNFVRGRVYDFGDIAHPITINGVDYVAPGSDFLTVMRSNSLKEIDPLTGYFGSVRDFTLARATEMQLPTIHSYYPAGKVPHSATMTIVTNATSINSDMASQVNEMAKAQKYSLNHITTYSSVQYRMKTSASTRHMCAQSFQGRIQELPLEYDETIYKKFVSDFGTHVIIGARFGGTISTFATMDSCDAPADADVREAFATFKTAAAKFTVNGTEPVLKVLDKSIKRSSQWSCGGRSSYYGKFDAFVGAGVSGNNPFSAWKASIFKDLNKPCIIAPDLIPIWATIRPVDAVIQGHLAAAVLDYMRTAISESEIDFSPAAEVKACSLKS